MNYQQKMTAAIESAERWQHEVVQYEDMAMIEAMKIIREKRDRKERGKPVEMGPVLVAHIKKVLENDAMYHRAVGNRNAQQTLAQMYGTAALVAAEYGDPAPPPLKRALPRYIEELCDDARAGQLHKAHLWADIDGTYRCNGA